MSRLAVAASLVVVVFLSACSGGNQTIEIPFASTTSGPAINPPPTTRSSGPATTPATNPPTEPGTQPGQPATSDGYVSAIDRAQVAFASAQGGTYGTEEFGMTRAQLATRIEETEAAIGSCMATAGFEYVPVDFSTVRQAMGSDKTAPGLSGSEYRSQYGFGIATQPDKPIVRIGLGEQNRRIFDGLSAADQVAYNRTLSGEDETATFAYALELENVSRTGGCTRAAIEQLFTPEELDVNYFNPADAFVELDPRAQAALADWSSCLAESGFSYRHPDDIEFDLQVRYDSIVQGRDLEELTGPDLEILAALQEEERALAVAAHPCEVQLDRVIDPIETELFGR